MVDKNYKISFCTVCMNRLAHLMKTLPANISDNRSYYNLEFILLDYNSSDGVEDYVKKNLSEYILNGKLIYYKTFKPQHFNRSHSRNLAFKLASGDIICNIDADNFTGEEFANYINNEFKNDNIFLTTIGSNRNNKDVLGRICIKKEDFYKVKGYDERMVNYGFEDYDLANRLEISGISRSIISKSENLQAITHEQKERLSNEYVSNNLKMLLLSYLTPSSTDFLFVFNNGEFRRGTVIDNQTFEHPTPPTPLREAQTDYKFCIVEDEWDDGNWEQRKKNKICLSRNEDNEILSFNQERNCFISSRNSSYVFYLIYDIDVIQQAVMLFSQLTNRLIMDKNKLEGRTVVNGITYGNDIVYKNFDYGNAIIVK